VKALQGAAAQNISSTGIIDANNIKNSPVGIALANAEAEVHKCFTKFGVRLASSVPECIVDRLFCNSVKHGMG
jgi:hypothetical protein